MVQKIQIKPNAENHYKVEVLVDGVNIADRICRYTLTQEAGSYPVLEVKSTNLSFELDGEAVVIDKTAREEIKRLREQHEHDMEKIKTLNDALMEYQRKCMRADIERIF